MKNIRMAVSRLNDKKVPALALVLFAVVGAVAGVLGASISISTSANYKGEAGTIHQNSGVFAITDTGLTVVNNANATNGSGSSFTIPASAFIVNNVLVQGDWVDTVTFVDSSPSTTTGTYHPTLSFYQHTGSSASGTLIKTVTGGTWTVATTSSGTVSFEIDLGAGPFTAPITAYITVT